ncbi:DUF2971 domain-containing protein [Bacillus safensis subsp. safensis]|uniref:DUF2971 domain-containing protein n=1 Tax=Bacillus safensis TaxID=561879 RepID=UPI0037BF612E
MSSKNYSSMVFEYIDLKKKPPLLYHYTSVYGLEGILKNKEFWISHSDFLNDKTERQYTLNLLINIVQKKLENYPAKMKAITDFIQRNLNKKIYPTYVLSLSKNKDSNLLWSNYSQDDGYNIEFDLSSFKEYVSFPDQNVEDSIRFYCSKVIYDSQVHEKALNELADNYIEVFAEYAQKKDEIDFIESVNSLLVTFQLLAAFFKDSCFQQEEEYRIAIYPVISDDLSYECRVTNGAFIPYIRMKFDRSAVKGITIGPKNKMDISEEGLRSFLSLNKFDLEPIEINRSKIPYRY